MCFSKKLKNLRTSKGLTQNQLSDELEKIYNVKFSNRNISYYEREESGATIPDLKIVEALAKYFNVTANYLLGIEELSQEEEIINRLIQKTVLKENSWKKENEIVEEFEKDPSIFHYQRAISALKSDETLNNTIILNTIKITPSISGYYILFKDEEDIIYLYHLKEKFEQDKLNYSQIYISDSSKTSKISELYESVMLETQPSNRTTLLNELLEGLD